MRHSMRVSRRSALPSAATTVVRSTPGASQARSLPRTTVGPSATEGARGASGGTFLPSMRHLRKQPLEVIEVPIPRELLGAFAGDAGERTALRSEGVRQRSGQGILVFGILDHQVGERAVEQLGGTRAAGGDHRDAGSARFED